MDAEKPETSAPPGLSSPAWFTPLGHVRLLNGVWVADAPQQAPHSSSARSGAGKPRNMREKLEREAQEKAEKHH